MITIVGLAQEDEGILGNSDRRIAIAYKIIKRAEALYIHLQGFVIDCITPVEGITCSPHHAGVGGDDQ
jgi:hypothetical protein